MAQTVQIQISWLLKKPTDLDLHCLQKQGISGFSRTKVKSEYIFYKSIINRWSVGCTKLMIDCEILADSQH